MITLGVDLASQPAKTAAALIEWSAKRAKVLRLSVNVDDAALLDELVPKAAFVGIDAPFGWPLAFVEMVSRHGAGAAVSEPGWSDLRRRALRLRTTDRWVFDELGRLPLSVSSDWIAVPAMRCAHLLGHLGVVDRSGGVSGRGKSRRAISEVYPGAALQAWELPSRNYKGRDRRDARAALLDALLERAPWLDLAPRHRERCHESDDCLDAVVAALVARAQAKGVTRPIPELAQAAARIEGWIVLPREGTLHRLV
ncbi:hypothetical protein PPSIR1_39055 [Plesiocystis pacifica SIR-1]|uniref:DUF429 domain-containing protein n=1 Tax=Plesiocystis pacifica SIR-1 TaxID=391625 RepID=A6GK13_9BACT|nr:hypothetical protein PPSIR1_39055 [Plesiocystis pacifica SIR-1]